MGKDNKIITIYAEDKKGLIGQILVPFNRSGYPVLQLNVSRTDVHETVIITLEVEIPDDRLLLFKNRIEKIIEVHQVFYYENYASQLHQVGHFRLADSFLGSAAFALLQKYGAVITHKLKDSIIVQKTGTKADLQELYWALDGSQLLSYCTTNLIVAQSLVELDKIF